LIMKQCPVCKSTYTDDSLSFCLNDGAALAAPSTSSEVTQQMSLGANQTFGSNVPTRPEFRTETPTQISAPQNTIQTEQKRTSPLLILAILGLLAIIGIAGAAAVYFAFIKPENSVVVNSSPTPKSNVSPTQNSNSDETQALKDKLDKLEKQLNEQKNAKTNPTVPVIPSTPQSQTAVTARVDSPNDGFLALRTAPSAQNGSQILKIPHGASVNVVGCQGYITIGNRRGRWCRVNYASQQGWAFDGFLIY
jgi:hypothetical protein